MAAKAPSIRLRCRATAFVDAASLDSDVALLDGAERSFAQRLLHAEDRRDYIAAHALLRRTLSTMAPGIEPATWRFDRTDWGKPFVAGAERGPDCLPFSLSHTRDFVACAVGRAGTLGVDVERDAAFDLDPLLASVCSPEERARIEAIRVPDRMTAFLDLWTVKEAYWKARGLGIVEDLTAAAFELREDGRIAFVLPPEDRAKWSFVMLRPVPESRIALAVARDDDDAALELDAAMIEPDGSLRALRPAQGSAGHRAEAAAPMP